MERSDEQTGTAEITGAGREATLQTLEDEARVIKSLERLVRDRVTYLKGIPMTREQLAMFGAEQWRVRLSAVLGPEHKDEATLDLNEAVLALVSTLAHFSVADGREWKG